VGIAGAAFEDGIAEAGVFGRQLILRSSAVDEGGGVLVMGMNDQCCWYSAPCSIQRRTSAF
jgi:hypothetical protein